MIIKIESHILRALNACVAGKDDPRFLLQGLCLDLTEQGNPLLVSTNGHVLLAAPVEVVSPDNAPGETSIDLFAFRPALNGESPPAQTPG